MELIEKLSAYHQFLYKEWVASVEYQRMGAKTTACLITLKNGFEIVGTSACVKPEDYNELLGQEFALEDALSDLDRYAGFYRQVTGLSAEEV